MIEVNTPQTRNVIHALGLTSLYTLDMGEYDRYVSAAYTDSETSRMDEIYRMYENTLLHKATGIRISYLTVEDYDGEVEKFIISECFIFTNENEKQDVTSVDLENGKLTTSAGVLPFSAIRKTYEKGD